MAKRTYIDSCVLMAAFQGKGELGWSALGVLDDPERHLVLSEAVRLEVMHKPRYEKRKMEVDFYQAIFDEAECKEWCIEVLQCAQNLADKHGIAAMDAIHVAHAQYAQVDEFVTAESTTKPMFRAKGVVMRSIRPS